MLPASKHVEGLYLGEDLLGKIPASALVIECSTIAPDSARKVAQAAEARGIAMIDAPVSGGTGGAAAGTLLHRRRPARRAGARPSGAGKMGKNIFHAGAAGAGQVAKICNNMLLGILMAGTSERAGAGRGQWPGSQGAVGHHRQELGPQLGHRTLQPLARRDGTRARVKGYAGGFGVDLMLRTWAWRPRPRWRRAPRFRWASWRATCIRCTALAARASWISPAS